MTDCLEWTRWLARAIFDQKVMALIYEGWAEYDAWKAAELARLSARDR